MTPLPDPLILTAAFDATSAATFQRLRDAHFPPRLNIVPAHLTLFHNLPGTERQGVRSRLASLARTMQAIPFRTESLRFLGRGVALDIGAPPLVDLRRSLAESWQSWLGAQDRQGFRPHVTVQNKVLPAAARALRDELASDFPAIAGLIVGLDLWHYRGGPWDLDERHDFAG